MTSLSDNCFQVSVLRQLCANLLGVVTRSDRTSELYRSGLHGAHQADLVVGIFLFRGQDVLKYAPGDRIIIAHIGDDLAIKVDRSALCNKALFIGFC